MLFKCKAEAFLLIVSMTFSLIGQTWGWNIQRFHLDFTPKFNRVDLSGKLKQRTQILATLPVLFLSFAQPMESWAVSGGGKDYATKDLRGIDFTSHVELNKDFTQCDASNVKFVKSDLKGSRFYRANLKEADFTGADLTGVSLEDTSLVNAVFKDAILEGAYLSASITDASSIDNADFTDAQMPDFVMKKLCLRPDAIGSNPKSGISTRESLFCE